VYCKIYASRHSTGPPGRTTAASLDSLPNQMIRLPVRTDRLPPDSTACRPDRPSAFPPAVLRRHRLPPAHTAALLAGRAPQPHRTTGPPSPSPRLPAQQAGLPAPTVCLITFSLGAAILRLASRLSGRLCRKAAACIHRPPVLYARRRDSPHGLPAHAH
jgi:hypothetical protein